MYSVACNAQVLQGRVQIRTRSKAAFEHGLECSVNSSNSSPGGSSSTGSPGASSTCSGRSRSPGSCSSGGSKTPAGGTSPARGEGASAASGGAAAGGASEADLRALFDSIDKDGSGETLGSLDTKHTSSRLSMRTSHPAVQPGNSMSLASSLLAVALLLLQRRAASVTPLLLLLPQVPLMLRSCSMRCQ
jgi:hypothetical protein